MANLIQINNANGTLYTDQQGTLRELNTHARAFRPAIANGPYVHEFLHEVRCASFPRLMAFRKMNMH